MNLKEFSRYLERDIRCVHCGTEGDVLIPQHRKNRGFGGSKERNRPSNVLVMCSAFNGLIEADAEAAALARKYGWKLESWEDPEDVPFFAEGKWWFVDNLYGRFAAINWD